MISVSVIVPSFDAKSWLGSCLNSIANQTLCNIEIICIDDGSSDGSSLVLSEFAARDPRIKVLTQANLGQGAARNRGLAVVKGKYVLFVDADDELSSANALEKLVGEADRERLDALFFDADTRVDAGIDVLPSVVRAEDYIRRHDYSWVFSGCELFERFLTNREYTVSPCLVLLRRKFLERCGIRFPEKRIFYEDNIFMTRVMLAAERASHRPWRLYLRKVHAGSSVTSAPTMRHLRGYLACYCDVCELLSRGDWSSRTRTVLRDRRAIYKLHVRRLAETNPKLVAEAKGEMSELEYATLREVLVYPFGEKIVNALRCLRDRGLFFTVKRIFCGRQDA